MPGWAASLRLVAFDSKATKRPFGVTARPGPESPFAGGASRAPRLTSATSPTAACATSGVSATSAASTRTAAASLKLADPSRPLLNPRS